MKRFLFFLAVMAVGLTASSAAAPAERPVKIIVSPDRSDWRYNCGERPQFTVTVLKYNCPVDGAVVDYQISEDMMKPSEQKQMTLKEGTGKIRLGTMAKPGFLRCRVFFKDNGYTYEGTATAAFEPERIEPVTTLPEDFDEFWGKAVGQNAKLPLEPVITHMPERSTAGVNVYHVSFQNFRRGARIYGILCVPNDGKAKHPAILMVPGAGIRGYKGYMSAAEKGAVTLQIGIHGLPVNLDPQVYRDLYAGALANYNRYRLDDRDQYYYKRVYLGCARAVDFLAELESVDADRIAVCGGSQGGALSVTTAVLNPKVKCIGAFYPALSDMTGYLHGRGGGWPHLFRDDSDDGIRNDRCMETTRYYDVANFARKLKAGTFMSLGYNDMVCCPTSTMAAYNVIPAQKELLIFNDIKHYTYPEQEAARENWLLERLNR